jgi:hypothetical protein
MKKKCTKCAEEKPLDCFYYDKRRRDGRQAECKKCAALRSAKRYLVPPTGPKKCTACKVIKPPGEFYAAGRAPHCKTCGRSRKQREYWGAVPDSKTCITCKTVKPSCEFYADGRSMRCKVCARASHHTARTLASIVVPEHVEPFDLDAVKRLAEEFERKQRDQVLALTRGT